MKFGAQSIVGAVMLFQTVSLGAAAEEERKLMPFHYGYGDGYGYSSGNARNSALRTRGEVQGSAYLRPYDIGNFQAYNPEREAPAPRPPATKSAKGGSKGTKTAKWNDNYQAPRSKAYKSSKLDRGTHEDAGYNPAVRPARGRSYIGSMHWERIPGQPIFVSQNDVPIIVLDTQPTVVVDNQGNTILTDEDGNEIIVSVDEFGNPSVTVDTTFVEEEEEEEEEETEEEETEDGAR